MLDSLEFRDAASVLDLGCGYGVTGICFGMLSLSSRVVMSDVNERALKLARENVKRNAISNVDVVEAAFARHLKDETFDLVLCNPPLR